MPRRRIEGYCEPTRLSKISKSQTSYRIIADFNDSRYMQISLRKGFRFLDLRTSFHRYISVYIGRIKRRVWNMMTIQTQEPIILANRVLNSICCLAMRSLSWQYVGEPIGNGWQKRRTNGNSLSRWPIPAINLIALRNIPNAISKGHRGSKNESVRYLSDILPCTRFPGPLIPRDDVSRIIFSR